MSFRIIFSILICIFPKLCNNNEEHPHLSTEINLGIQTEYLYLNTSLPKEVKLESLTKWIDSVKRNSRNYPKKVRTRKPKELTTPEMTTPISTLQPSPNFLYKWICMNNYYPKLVICYTRNPTAYSQSYQQCRLGYYLVIDKKILKENIYLALESKSFWMPLKRKNNQAIYLTNATNFFILKTGSLKVTGNDDGKHCVVFNGTDFIAANCSDNFLFACIYNIDHYYKNCNKMIAKNAQQCFYFENRNEIAPRDEFCESSLLGEPYDLVEVTIIQIYALSLMKFCDIGIEYVNNMFVFASDRNYVPYIESIRTKIEGQYGSINNVLMRFKNETLTKCAFCQKSVNMENGSVRILLKNFFGSNQMQILVENMINVYNLTIYCFVGDKFKLETDLHEKTVIFLESKKKIHFDLPILKYPRYYWCEAINLTSAFIKSNVIYTYSKLSINIYSAIISILTERNVYPFAAIASLSFSDLSDEFLIKSIFPVEILSYENNDIGNVTVLYQFATDNTSRSDLEDYSYVRKIMSQLNNESVKVLDIFDGFYCSKEQTIDLLTGKTLTWPKSRIDTVATSEELCLQKYSLPVWRKCYLNELYKPTWSQVNGSCTIKPKTSELILHKLSISSAPISEVIKNTSLIEFKNTATVTDINLLADILKKVSVIDTLDVIDNVYKIFDNVVNCDIKTLKQSQIVLHSTDKILDSFDRVLLSQTNTSRIQFSSKFVITKIANLSNDNIAGWGLQKTYNVIQINRNNTLQSVIKMFEEYDLIIATFIDNKTFSQLEKMNNYLDMKLTVSFFLTNSIFNDPLININQQNATLPIVDILLTHFQGFFIQPVSILYFSNYSNTSCGYWLYGQNDSWSSIAGSWKRTSEYDNKTYILICNYSHLTQFAMLGAILNDKKSSDKDDNTLYIISIVGCSLSLVGSIVVLLIALVSKKWRNDKSSILFFNFLFSVILTYILFFISVNVTNPIMCSISGMLLHYSLLAQFIWTLIFSYFQYNRYVNVFNPRASHTILKSSLAAWTLPIIPIIIIAGININYYHQTTLGVCYLTGLRFHLGVLLPIGVILAINMFILLKIIISLVCKRQNKNEKKEWRYIVRLVYILFFFLGLNWVFGLLLPFYENNVILSYIFSLTTASQGFILCVLYLRNSSSKLSFFKCFKR